MSRNISERIEYIKALSNKKLSVKEVSIALKISQRQVYNLLNKYNLYGIIGLRHGLCGQKGHNTINEAIKDKVLDLITNKYYDCGATLASELLEEDEGIRIHRETLRLWMKQSGLTHKGRKRKPYRQRRARKEYFGELLQIDGSFHRWFNGEKTCLINLIDDASSYNICLFEEQETSVGAALLLWQWIQKFGIPRAIYCDKRNAYVMGDDKVPPGFFGQLCHNLKIQVIPANSPQAKGRVERSNRTHQERLIPKLRLHNIKTITEANKYLTSHYLYGHNKRFAHNPNSFENKHLPLQNNLSLNDVCFIQDTRKVNNDMTISLQWKIIQITRKNYCPPKSIVVVRFTLTEPLKYSSKTKKWTLESSSKKWGVLTSLYNKKTPHFFTQQKLNCEILILAN